MRLQVRGNVTLPALLQIPHPGIPVPVAETARSQPGYKRDNEEGFDHPLAGHLGPALQER